MREIIFDTETTGFKPEEGERIIEIGAVEMVNRSFTGRVFHEYVNPEGREVNPGAFEVHGISNEFLADKPAFSGIASAFLEFIGEDAILVAHNAPFDINFLNHEFARLSIPAIDPQRVVDTLVMARKKHPMAQNSLDRLCERYKIDNSSRTKHGALLDSELLAEVYIELLGGRQAAFELEPAARETRNETGREQVTTDRLLARPSPLPSRLTEADIEAHRRFVGKLGEDALWNRYG